MLAAFILSSDFLFIFSLPCPFVQYNILASFACLSWSQLGDPGDQALVIVYIAVFMKGYMYI